jgi:hypothetical protein
MDGGGKTSTEFAEEAELPLPIHNFYFYERPGKSSFSSSL